MREAARGDVSKLCQHTRELLNKLYATRETTTVLLANLLGALASAPNGEFHLWLQRPMIIKGTNDSESYTLTLQHDKCLKVKILYYQQCTKYTEPIPMWISYNTDDGTTS